MSQQNPFARPDLLLHRLCGYAVQTYLEPHIGRQVWDNGLDRVVARSIARAGVPQQPITHVQIGRMSVPIEAFQFAAQVCGLLPGRELPPGAVRS